ncbi:MAG TPA: hypothetical protein PLV92_06025, partial [Pirellulaceae bacterium]|nr:hypothetical protein [Pirellulaceae bacterium]
QQGIEASRRFGAGNQGAGNRHAAKAEVKQAVLRPVAGKPFEATQDAETVRAASRRGANRSAAKPDADSRRAISTTNQTISRRRCSTNRWMTISTISATRNGTPRFPRGKKRSARSSRRTWNRGIATKVDLAADIAAADAGVAADIAVRSVG